MKHDYVQNVEQLRKHTIFVNNNSIVEYIECWKVDQIKCKFDFT